MASTDKFEFCEADSSLRSIFEAMFRNGELTDVTVKIGDSCFHGHSTILAATFPYFRTLFKRNKSNNGEEPITLHLDSKAFESLLDFAYTGRISVSEESVKELLIAANYLQHTKIRESCFKYLSGQFTPQNVLELSTLGKNLNCFEFVRKTDTYIDEKFELVRKTQAFLNAPFELLMEIVSSNDIKVDTTENVYKAISEWLKAHPERTNKFMELVTCVQKKLPLPIKRCRNADGMDDPSKKITPCTTTLLEVSDYYYDVFGIYTVSISASHNRVIHNYNCYTSSWSKIAQHNEPRSFTTVVSARGQIFAFTGDNLEYFDRHSWTTCGSLPWDVKSRSGNAVTHGNKVYWFPNISNKSNSVWCFNADTHEWRKQVSSMKLISPGFVSLGCFIYMLGGFTSSGVTDVAMTYDPIYAEFQKISHMLESRSSPRCAALNEKVYVCGGYGCRSAFLDSAEVYDPLELQWQCITPMRKKWSNFSVVPCEGELFLIGKHENADNTVEIYDPDKNVWKSGADFPDKWSTLRALVISV